jgi:hypothetical protein
LLSLQPGVAYLGNELNADTDTRSGAINGLRSDQSNVTLDGIGVNDQNNGYAFQSVLNVPPDSVEEFRVTTAKRLYPRRGQPVHADPSYFTYA